MHTLQDTFYAICCDGFLDDEWEFDTLDDEEISYGLQLACDYDRTEIVEWILQNTVDRVLDIHMALSYAIQHQNIELIRLLCEAEQVEHNFNIHYHKGHFIELACDKDNVEIVQYLLSSPQLKHVFDINRYIEHILHWIAEYRSYHVLDYLLYNQDISKEYLHDCTFFLSTTFDHRDFMVLEQLLRCSDFKKNGIPAEEFLSAVIRKDKEMALFLLEQCGLDILSSPYLSTDDYLFRIPEVTKEMMKTWKEYDYCRYIDLLPRFQAWCFHDNHTSLWHDVNLYVPNIKTSSEIELHM